MNVVSQRSDGCLAFDGGQTCPFFSDVGAPLADMMLPKKSRVMVKSGVRNAAENVILFQARDYFEQIYYNGWWRPIIVHEYSIGNAMIVYCVSGIPPDVQTATTKGRATQLEPEHDSEDHLGSYPGPTCKRK